MKIKKAVLVFPIIFLVILSLYLFGQRFLAYQKNIAYYQEADKELKENKSSEEIDEAVLRETEAANETETANETEAVAGLDSRQELPAVYDGRGKGRVPMVKNQGSSGTCWAFASLNALEARLLPHESLEFSEDHMSLNNGFEIAGVEGGEFTMSMAYLLSWRGPVLESEDPYGDHVSPDGLKAVKHVQEIVMVPGKDYEKIKRAVLEYGGVQSALYTSMTDSTSHSVYYNEENNSYCYIGSAPPNHDSVIVGWDDQYPKENFNEEVGGDGAFICMNSWGDEFGDQGFFYVSYYDSNIGMNNIVYTKVEEPDNYSRIYQSDLRGWVGQLGFGEETVWFANVFRAEEAEKLEAAGFYATGPNTAYEVYVAPLAEGEKEIEENPGLQDRFLAARGTLEYAGYYTVPLRTGSRELELIKGSRFAVIVKITTPGAVHPAAIEYDAEDGRTVVDITDGEGYISQDGVWWERVEKKKDCNLCLKAYTSDQPAAGEGENNE